MYFMDFNEVVATVNRQDFEWALEQAEAKGEAKGEAKKEAKIASTVIHTIGKEGKNKNEIISFLTTMLEVPQSIAERYYDQELAVH